MPPRAITPSQTVGPFFAYALTPEAYGFEVLAGNVLRAPDVEGESIRIEGHMFDGAGAVVPDAMVEIWHADGAGLYAAPLPHGTNSRFSGFGRCETKDGSFWFETVKPGAVRGPDGALQAPHINVAVFARGLLKQLFTRLYFEGEPLNATDAVLNLVPEHRRHTLVATRAAPSTYVFNIRLQGGDETVFFEA
jgi:protocatechuate 3,4-dioxygenase, alpha subunit